jgi:tetratricopeptide (TPR) repeat protein
MAPRYVRNPGRPTRLDASAFRNAKKNYEEGCELADRGFYDEAIRYFDRALERFPNADNALLERSDALLHLRRFGEALEDLNRYIAINPDSDYAYTNRAIIYSRKRRYAEAILDLSEAINVNPLNPTTYFNRGVMLARVNRLREAITDFEQVLKLDPTDRHALTDLAHCHESLGHSRKAERYMKQAADQGDRHAKRWLTKR